MAENRSLSSSEQYIKKSNRRLLFIGLGLLVLFLIALAFLSDNKTDVQSKAPVDFRTDDFAEAAGVRRDASLLPYGGNAQLVPDPNQVNMTNVVLGSKAESIITLKATNAPILFLGMELAQAQQDGFTLETTCTPNARIDMDASCVVKVLWNPVELRQIQNTLNIRWREDSNAVYREETTSVRLTAQSTDSKDCVICENVTAQPKEPKMAMGFNGNLYEIDKDGFITVNGKRVKKTDNDLFVDETGAIVGIAQPEWLALSMDHRVIGKVSDTQDVINDKGEKVGRLLGDGTIVTSDLKVVGAAVPIVSVMNAQNQIIGKLLSDGTVVDGTNTVIGRPLVDGSIVNLEGTTIGSLRPWGLVIDFKGTVIGGILPDGNVSNADSQNVAKITQTGLAIDATGELIGGVVPKGVAVGAGCNTVGTVLLNGQVKDSYEQIVGTAMVDGSVVNSDMEDLGAVISQGLVINEKGAILGFVNSAGKAVDAKGSVIGCVNPDGSISAGKKLIGAVMEKGRVIGNGCSVLGSVYPDGSVISDASEVIGKVLADKYVTNANNRVIGVVVPKGTAVAEGCRLLGLISLTGRVIDTTGMDVGCVTPERRVINAQGEVIGSVTPRGSVVDNAGKIIGRLRIDGKVMDKDGKVIGCVNPDGTLTDLNGKPLGTLVGGEATGVILDDNGNPTGWTAIGSKVYDATGNEIGSLLPNMQAVDMNGNLMGIMPQNGVVFSNDGLVLGRYSQKTGVAVNMSGERFAKILPDMTAISGDKGEIIGALIPDNSNFMALDGTFMGTMQIDGVLPATAGGVAGAIRADGSVVDKTGKVVGTRIPTGTVYSSTGSVVGTVNARGEVVSAAKTVIGRVLGNGLALSTEGAILGGVYNETAIPMGTNGLLGSIGTGGIVNDKNGRRIGFVSPFGLIMGSGGDLLGYALRVGPFIDANGSVVGWVSFQGEVNGLDGRPMGQALSNGTALDRDGKIIGSLAPRGTAVNAIGTMVGTVAPNARVFGADGAILGSFKMSDFMYNTEQRVVGRRLKPGVALDTNGDLIGWTRTDGIVENATQAVGLVSLDGRIFAENGAVLGFYVPLGEPVINDTGKTVGFMGTNGVVINTRGETVGKAISPDAVVRDGKMIGRFLGSTDFVNDAVTGAVIGQAGPNGMVTHLSDAKPLGTLMMNGLALNLTQQVVGGLSTMGIPFSNSLSVLGQALIDGQIMNDGRNLGRTLANTMIYDLNDRLVGNVIKPNAFIGRDGRIIGAAEGDLGVISIDGSPIANQMPFGSALTTDSIWAGGAMPMGVVITDDGYDVGVIASDGAVIGTNDTVMARVLPDGSAAGITERNTFTAVPYVGSVARQGLPVSYKGQVMGRTTITGDILDASDKKTNRILDDGTILGSSGVALSGVVVPMTSAINHNGEVIGMVAGDGAVLSVTNQIQGTIATNGAVKGNSALKIVGGTVPSELVTNGCKVMGQTTPDGQIVNGRGDLVGRVLVDKTAISRGGEKIGRTVRHGGVLSTNGDFLGRTMPDASVVDSRGSNIGCVAPNGDVQDTAGTKLGCVLERGPIISPNGEIIARSRFDGTLVSASGAVIGQMSGNCRTAVDADGKTIGRIAGPDEELMYNPDGTIAGTFDRAGIYYNLEGVAIFQVLPNGDIVDPKTNKVIGRLDENGVPTTTKGDALDGLTLLLDANGNPIGIISGCSVLNLDGEKIATIMADGSIMDLNGELYASISGDGKLFDKNGQPMGNISGTNTRLDRCGIKSTTVGSDAAAGRRIFIGNKAFPITSTGSIVDENGTVVGYMGEDGRPYTLDNRPLGSADSSGRTRPNLSQNTVVDPEQISQMQQLLAQKRQSMRAGVKSSSIIRPDGRLLARAKKKQDADWGLPRIVSSWPVKMDSMILRDKAIPAVLVRSIDSRYKDVPATAIVERHIYSEEGRNIIIPAGSRLIGKISGAPGQNHVAKMELRWERLIRPDGGAFSFNGVSGDAQGRGGVAAYLDEQLLAKYGKPMISSTVTSAIMWLAASNDPVTTTEGGTRTQSDRSKAAEDARETFRDNMDQIFQQLIDDATKVPPVVFVPAGTRLTVFANEDLWLRSEEEDVRDYDTAYGQDSKDAKKAPTSSWVDKRKPTENGTAMTSDTEYYAPEDGYNYADYEDETVDDGTVYNGEENDTSASDDSTSSSSSSGQSTQTPTQPDLSNRISKPVLPKTTTSNKMF